MEEYVHILRTEVLVLVHSTSTQPKRAEEGQEQEQEQEPLRRCASTSRACGVPSPAPFLCQQLDPNKFLEARQGLGQEPQSKGTRSDFRRVRDTHADVAAFLADTVLYLAAQPKGSGLAPMFPTLCVPQLSTKSPVPS